MKCPKCKEKMTEVRKDTSHDFKHSKKYSRMVYQCKKEDIWITVETPK